MSLSLYLSLYMGSLGSRAASLFALVILLQIMMAKVSLQKETKRRLQHALTGHAMVQISYVLPPTLAIGLLLLGAGGMYILQTRFPKEFRRTFGPLLRSEELSGAQLPGAFYFLLGTALAVLLSNDINTARYSVECLAIADPVASWIGSTISSPKINSQSSVSGCAACFVAAWCVGYLMLGTDTYTISVGALVCTIAEGMPYGNDNLNIPVLTALAVEKFG
jgi:dolichol kinase